MFRWIAFLLMGMLSFSVFAYETISKEVTIVEVVSSTEFLKSE